MEISSRWSPLVRKNVAGKVVESFADGFVAVRNQAGSLFLAAWRLAPRMFLFGWAVVATSPSLQAETQGTPAGSFDPPGSLYDNGVANGTYTIPSQDSTGMYTSRAADDFILVGGCPNGYYEITGVRAQVAQHISVAQPFALNLFADNGSGSNPDPFNAIVPVATFFEASRSLLGTLNNLDLFEVGFSTPGLYVAEGSVHWLSPFGSDAVINGFFDNYVAASDGAAGASPNGLAIAPEQLVPVWTDIGLLGAEGSQALSFAVDGSCPSTAPRSEFMVGDEFQVNSVVEGSQEAPAAAATSTGGFVAVWQTETGTAFRSIRGQRFSPDGSTVGGEFTISDAASNGWSPDLAVDGANNLVVVWQAKDIDGNPMWDVFGRLYSADGMPLGDPTLINTYTPNNQYEVSVDRAPSGEFVVVWTSWGSVGDDVSQTSIQGRRYLADGSPAGDQFQINSLTAGSQWSPSVAMRSDGGFVVAWESEDVSSGDFDGSVQARRFGPDENPLGDEFLVNTYPWGLQKAPALDIARDDSFLIVWSSEFSDLTDTSGTSILGQRFSADGVPDGGEFAVNFYAPGDQTQPDVAFGNGREFVVVWASGVAPWDISGLSVHSRRFGSDAAALEAEYMVNAFTFGFQWRPTLAMDPFGDFFVGWDSSGSNGSDHDGASIQAQRFRLSLFHDGFESGDTLEWSSTTE
ncbi:MAG: hypothetical protein K8J08_14470 [Thermoanaerobaculia bacterium]|nr:hypothetical protein [Thermoanaerobaculia bacterium]